MESSTIGKRAVHEKKSAKFDIIQERVGTVRKQN